MTATTVQAPFFGWRAVWAAFVLAAFGWGVGFYGPPIFLHAVIERTGWSLTLVSSAVTVHFLIGVVVVANLARLYRRFGVPAITITGALSLAVGVLGWALAAEPWQLILAALLSGAGWVCLGAAALNAIIAPWFVHTRTKALSMAYNGSSIGGIILSPLWVALIAWYGFGSAAVLVGVVMVAIVGVLSWLVLAKTPAQLGQLPDGDAVSAVRASITATNAQPQPGGKQWRDRAFITLAAGMALGLFAQIGLLAHLFSILVPALGAQGAGLAMAAATLAAMVGRTLVAWTMPIKANRRYVACASYVVQITGSLVLIAAGGDTIALLWLGVVLFGCGIGNATSLPPLIAQVEFIEADVQRVVSLIVACAQATYSFAPAVFGLIRVYGPAALDLPAGNATGVFVLAIVTQVLAIGCLLLGRR